MLNYIKCKFKSMYIYTRSGSRDPGLEKAFAPADPDPYPKH